MTFHKEGYADPDFFNPDEIKFGYWENKEGLEIKISDIENSYLENIIKFLKSKYEDSSKLVELENEKRLRILEASK